MWQRIESGYNAPRLHVAMQARKIVVSGETIGLHFQWQPPAAPGRFDSCDLRQNPLTFSAQAIPCFSRTSP